MEKLMKMHLKKRKVNEYLKFCTTDSDSEYKPSDTEEEVDVYQQRDNDSFFHNQKP